MKTKLMMVAALAAVTFASCSKDGDNNGLENANEASLNINVVSAASAASAGVDSRATTALATDKIENYTVFVTDGTGEIQWSEKSTDGTSITGMAVKSDASKVFIVANCGDLTGTITSRAQLDAYLLDMTAAGNQFNTRVATGESSSILFTNSGGNLTANVSVNLTFVAARITVKIVDKMSPKYDATNSAGNLVLKNVAVMNAVKESKLFGASLMGTPAHYLTGIDAGTDFSLWPANGSYTVDSKYVDAITANDFSTTYHYYVFENDALVAGEFPTIVTIEGEYKGDKLYYPVHLASYELWSADSQGNYPSVPSVQRGKSYEITITLNVDPTDPDGTTDPTKPEANASINIDVTLNDWDPITLNKEF